MTKGWEIRPLGEVCEIRSGGTPSKSKAEYWGAGIPWVSPKDMKTSVVSDSIDHITATAVTEGAARLVPVGSLLVVVRSGILARTIPVARTAATVAVNQDIKALIPSATVQPEYLQYLLGSMEPSLLKSVTRGATVHRLETPVLQRLPIPIPPLAEQERIVRILDTALGWTRAVSDVLRAEKVDYGLLFDSALNRLTTPRADWTASTIGGETHFIDYRGKTPPKSDAGIPLITAKNIRMGYLRAEPREYIDSALYQDWMRRGIPRKGDVLFTTEAPLANVAQLDTSDPVALAQRVIVMQTDPARLNPGLLKYLLLSSTVQSKIRDHGTGATATGIKASLLRTIPIHFPPRTSDQKDIVNTLDRLSAQVTSLDKTLSKRTSAVDNLRESLLHQAFTGQL